MKKLVKSMATLLMVAGVVGFMGCKQPTDEFEPVAKPLQVGVKVLPEGTDGNFGPSATEGEYVEFGYWPQSKKADSVKLGTKITNVNGWSCLTGADGAYYVKVKAAPFGNDYTFDDGSAVESVEYYFKLEPIQWRVLTNDYKIPDGQNEDGTNKYKSSGKKLLFAEKALAASCFYHNQEDRNIDNKTISPNNYKESDIRTYLNNDFINKAFTPAEIENILPTVVDNSAESTFGTGETGTENPYACDNTEDHIFLLSEKEITTAEYGFDAYDKYVGDTNQTLTSTRIRKTTDYARATGAWVGAGKFKGNSTFWLRSPLFSSNYARPIYCDGRLPNDIDVSATIVSVVPALSMDF